jgi:hypothetical protein
MPRKVLVQPLAALALAFAWPAFAQPPGADQSEAPATPPEQICLTNACAKPATNRPPPPTPDRPSNTTLLPKGKSFEEVLAEQDSFGGPQFDGPPPPPELLEQIRNSSFGISQSANLRSNGLSSASVIPEGMALEVMGAVWLADGGYLPPGTTTMLNSGGFNTTTNINTGGSPYGSATSYQVAGDMISINKAIQIGDQPMVMANLQVRSGQTATVRLPDGSTFQVTPKLRPLTAQEVQQKAMMDQARARTAAAPRP